MKTNYEYDVIVLLLHCNAIVMENCVKKTQRKKTKHWRIEGHEDECGEEIPTEEGRQVLNLNYSLLFAKKMTKFYFILVKFAN